MDDLRTSPITQASFSGTNLQPQQEPHHSKPLRVFLIILLVVLIAWGVYALLQKQTVPQEEEKDYTLQTAQEGQLIGSFPKELIPEEGVVIDASAELTYTNRQETLPTAEYSSKKTLDENIVLFKDLLTTQGWTIVKEAVATEAPVTNFYATKEGNDVNITLLVSAAGVKVHIAYVARQ